MKMTKASIEPAAILRQNPALLVLALVSMKGDLGVVVYGLTAVKRI